MKTYVPLYKKQYETDTQLIETLTSNKKSYVVKFHLEA